MCAATSPNPSGYVVGWRQSEREGFVHVFYYLPPSNAERLKEMRDAGRDSAAFYRRRGQTRSIRWCFRRAHLVMRVCTKQFTRSGSVCLYRNATPSHSAAIDGATAECNASLTKVKNGSEKAPKGSRWSHGEFNCSHVLFDCSFTSSCTTVRGQNYVVLRMCQNVHKQARR